MELTDDRPTRVYRYSAPSFFPVPAILLIIIPFQLFLHFSSHPFATATTSLIESKLGHGFVGASVKFLLGVHGAEASYILSQCIKYHAPPDVAVKYVLVTFMIGYEQMRAFNRQVRISEKGKSKSL